MTSGLQTSRSLCLRRRPRRSSKILVTYVRSSSYGTFDWCQQQYYFQYVLGLNNPSCVKAQKGNAVHKGLEILARKKLALQNGQTSLIDGELGEHSLDSITEARAIDLGHSFYSDPVRAHGDWKPEDKTDCEKWFYHVLNFNNGMFHPLKRDVVTPEQYFDFTIDKPWAAFDYTLPDGRRLQGQLAVKGTIDLVTRVSPDTLEYIDWKTGQRKNWKTDLPKDWNDLRNDAQLLLYYYALRRLYPDQHVFVTIFYVRDGGPFTIPFDDADLPRFEAMLKKRFNEIRVNQRPKTIYRDGKQSWKCKYLCRFHTEKFQGTNDNMCKHIEKEIVSLGMDRVTAKYGRTDAFSHYGSGGGVENREGCPKPPLILQYHS